MNGMQCGSPALNGRRRCFFHERAREQHNRIVHDQYRQAPFLMPVLEDANAVQMALMQVMQLLAWGQMDHKTAGLLLYGLQTASANLRYADFEPEEPTDVVIRREDVAKTDIQGPQWDPEDFPPPDDEDEDEDGEKGLEDDGVTIEAAEVAVDAPAALANGGETRKAVPSMDEVRKKIKGMVHDYILRTGHMPMEVPTKGM